MQKPQLSELHPAMLDTRTTGNGHYVNVRHFPSNDHCEVSAILLDHTDSLKRGGGAQRENTQKEDMTAIALRKSQSRSRRKVRHLALSMNANRMLTCTFRENVTDLDEAWYVFKYFSKLMRQRFGDKYIYIAVPEFQKRGAVHFHLAINSFFNVNVVRAIWRRAAGNRGGNIDITSPKKHGKNSWSPVRVAQYLSKYITKNDSVDFNKKRYSSGGDIVIPDPSKGWLPSCMGAQVTYLCQLVESISHHPVSTIFETDNSMFPVVFIST